MKTRNELVSAWNQSYDRRENYIFYPKEEVVKFLNRFVSKRIGRKEFKHLISREDRVLRALDLGCGIGRQSILMKEFGLDAYGVDISKNALEMARNLSKDFDFDIDEKFILLEEAKLPFSDSFFDVAISDSVLDSMEFASAQKYMSELNRTVRGLLYLNLISSESNGENSGAVDVIVNSTHEKGTVQSYYDEDKLQRLLAGTEFKIIQMNKNTGEDLITQKKSVRFHVVLKKEETNEEARKT